MNETQYIGSRYVPIFADPIEHSSAKEYEPLTIVLYEGASYTSKQYVPVGVEITDTRYWALTGNYNAQLDNFENAIAQAFSDMVDLTNETIGNLEDATTIDYFYPEIGIEYGRTEDTDYYIAHVPLTDNSGNIIKPQIYKHPGKNPLQESGEIGATLGINGSAVIELANNTFVQGTTISDSVILNEHSYAGDTTLSPLDYPLYLCFNADREIAEISLSTNPSASSLIAAGYETVFPCYAQLADNGTMVPLDDWTPKLQINGTTLTSSTQNPMMLMGVAVSGDLYFLACDGRTLLNRGLHYETAVSLLFARGCTKVYLMDGGGSTCLVHNGAKINRNIDNDGTTVRNITYTLAFVKPSENYCQKAAFSATGLARQLTIEQLTTYINQNAFARRAPNTIVSNTDLNNVTTVGKYQCTTTSVAQSVVNNPFSVPFDLYVMQYGYYNNMVLQIAVSTSYPSAGYRNQMAFRFVDMVDETSVQPYVSNWTYIIDNNALKVTLGKNEEYTFKYRYNRPVMQLVYRLGNSSSGILIIEYDKYYIVTSTGLAVSDYLTITFDSTNRQITIKNTSNGRFNGVLTNGYWDE